MGRRGTLQRHLQRSEHLVGGALGDLGDGEEDFEDDRLARVKQRDYCLDGCTPWLEALQLVHHDGDILVLRRQGLLDPLANLRIRLGASRLSGSDIDHAGVHQR